jgi:retron-type reverse transcriptase
VPRSQPRLPTRAPWSHGPGEPETQRGGTKWLLNIDIADCCERVDHGPLLDSLREQSADARFINLMRPCLSAGYRETGV